MVLSLDLRDFIKMVKSFTEKLAKVNKLRQTEFKFQIRMITNVVF